ncbi:MAG TPA: ribbon-helix-helix protein, CopG family [Bryobacteraceae bacterium]|nr:ribbon-helix-helix protein, CopG family [Bryobacteraceae bacterium]
MRTRNITLRLPEPLLRRLRAYAAQRNSSLGALMAEAIRQMLDEDGSRDARHRRIVERMRNAPDWGTRGKITWTREEIWERTK